MNSRVMYIEDKSNGITGLARIGRVSFSKSGATLYYGGYSFQSLKGSEFKSNYFEVESGAEFWLSGPRKDGLDRLYGGLLRWMRMYGSNTGSRSVVSPLAATWKVLHRLVRTNECAQEGTQADLNNRYLVLGYLSLDVRQSRKHKWLQLL